MKYYITTDGTFGAAEDVSFFETDNLPEDFADWTDNQRCDWVARHQITRITPEEAPAAAGCWIDGHWGQYAVARLVLIAEDYGYSDKEILDIARRHMDECVHPGKDNDITQSEHEHLSDAGYEVESWLNEFVAPEGYSFGFHDGEFFFEPDGWWEEEG